MLSIPVVVGVNLENSLNKVGHLLIALVQIRSDASVQGAAHFVFLEIPEVHCFHPKEIG